MSTTTPIDPLPDGSHASNPASLPDSPSSSSLRPPSDPTQDDIDLPQPSSQRFKSISELMSTTTPIDPLPDGSPQIAPSSNPGPSGPSTVTENPLPSAKRPRPEEEDPWVTYFNKIFKGKLRRRISDIGASNAAQRDLPSTFNSKVYVTTSSLPLLSTNDRSHEHSDI
jgi:hypothetical protein